MINCLLLIEQHDNMDGIAAQDNGITQTMPVNQLPKSCLVSMAILTGNGELEQICEGSRVRCDPLAGVMQRKTALFGPAGGSRGCHRLFGSPWITRDNDCIQAFVAFNLFFFL